jgi:hypothetical protein
MLTRMITASVRPFVRSSNRADGPPVPSETVANLGLLQRLAASEGPWGSRGGSNAPRGERPPDDLAYPQPAEESGGALNHGRSAQDRQCAASQSEVACAQLPFDSEGLQACKS